jgi:hypothetical protein
MSVSITAEDEDFAALPSVEANRILNYIKDPLLIDNMHKIYECHGDPSVVLYVGGMSIKNKYCIYKTYSSDFKSDSHFIEYEDIVAYMRELMELDKLLFNRN